MRTWCSKERYQEMGITRSRPGKMRRMLTDCEGLQRYGAFRPPFRPQKDHVMSAIAARIEELGLQLPAPAAPPVPMSRLPRPEICSL